MQTSMGFDGKSITQETPGAGRIETGRSYWHILRANLFSFFNVILFSVGMILIVFGRYNDAFVTVSTGVAGTLVNAFHEIRAKRQLDQIALLVRPNVQVIRAGIEQSIAPAQLVQGDMIHLYAGDQALADGVVVSDDGGEMDESLLTGESDLVRKQQGDAIFSGSFCINGDLTYRAEAVGADSFASQLTSAARTFTPVSTPLQQQVALAIRLLMVLTVFMALVFTSPALSNI